MKPPSSSTAARSPGGGSGGHADGEVPAERVTDDRPAAALLSYGSGDLDEPLGCVPVEGCRATEAGRIDGHGSTRQRRRHVSEVGTGRTQTGPQQNRRIARVAPFTDRQSGDHPLVHASRLQRPPYPPPGAPPPDEPPLIYERPPGADVSGGSTAGLGGGGVTAGRTRTGRVGGTVGGSVNGSDGVTEGVAEDGGTTS